MPDKVGALLTSVAYRPAEGPGAGGDFYDVLPLTGGRVGFILGDVSGHGRGALARTAFMRYTLRAYLEAGLEPRVALQVAGRVIDDNLSGDFATVLLAVTTRRGLAHLRERGAPLADRGRAAPHDPVAAASSPPIGVGVRTGLRQRTVPLVPGSVACLFTDGLIEARTLEGVLGRERLTELLAEIGDDAAARRLIERVAAEANASSDDMAAVVVSPTAGVTPGCSAQGSSSSRRASSRARSRSASSRPAASPIRRSSTPSATRLLAERFGGVVLHVVFGNRLRVEVLPRNVESIEAASRRVQQETLNSAGDAASGRPRPRSARRPASWTAAAPGTARATDRGRRAGRRGRASPTRAARARTAGQALVDRGHQRRAAVALGERDLALEGERPRARPVVRERRAVGLHHHRVGRRAGASPGDRLDEQVAAQREDLAEALGAELAQEGGR